MSSCSSCPGTTAREARDAAQRLQELVEATGAAMGELGAELTASVGLCEWREPLTAGELLDRADRALRVAKHRGKRRAILATHETEDELARLEVQAGSPALLLRDLWDIVSCCERPRDVVLKLPDFLREELQLEARGPHRDIRAVIRGVRQPRYCARAPSRGRPSRS